MSIFYLLLQPIWCKKKKKSRAATNNCFHYQLCASLLNCSEKTDIFSRAESVNCRVIQQHWKYYCVITQPSLQQTHMISRGMWRVYSSSSQIWSLSKSHSGTFRKFQNGSEVDEAGWAKADSRRTKKSSFHTLADYTVSKSVQGWSLPVVLIQSMFVMMLLILPPPLAINTSALHSGKTQRLLFRCSDSNWNLRGVFSPHSPAKFFTKSSHSHIRIKTSVVCLPAVTTDT